MAAKTLVVAGAGPGLGLAIARRFGRAGFGVALIARSSERLAQMCDALKREGIDAAGFTADVTDDARAARVMNEIRNRFGTIDVLEFSPLAPPADPQNLSATGTTPEIAESQFRLQALGAISCVRHVLPDMIARKAGTIFITGGLSAHAPVPVITPIGMAMAAARNYALCLNSELANTGVYVAAVAIGVFIKEGDPVGDPSKLADLFYGLYEKRDRADVTVDGGQDLTEGLKAAVAARAGQ